MKGIRHGAVLVFGCLSGISAACVPALAADLNVPKKAPPPAAVVSPWDIAFGAAVMTDYNFRGVSQSNHKPSIASYFEPRYNFNDNLQAYVGISGESISFPNRAAAEIDLYTGIRPTFGKLALDFGFWEYYYPGGQCFNGDAAFGADCAANGPLPNGNVIKKDLSFYELYGKASYTVNDQLSFGGTVNWSPNVLNLGTEGTYVSSTAKYTLPTVLPNNIGWFVSADLGHWFLGGTTDAFFGNVPLKSYTNWDVGLGLTWKQFTLDLRYFDTNMSKVDCNNFTSDHTAVNGMSNWCGASFIAKLSVDLTSANLK
jgi:hypothetical protein